MEGTSDSAALLRLLRVTAIAANEASDIRTAAQVCLDETRKCSGWTLGHLYLAARDGSSLEPTGVWSVDDDRRYRAFQELTSRSVMPRGCGLPGRVLASGTPHWIEDVQRDANFPRANAAVDVGLHAALAFPILTQNQVSGVLEFFAPEVLAPNESLLSSVAELGRQLGRVIERQHAADDLRAAEAQARRDEERFSQSARLQAAGMLAGGIAHDFNNILTAIFGFSKLVLDELPEGPLRDDVLEIRDAAERGAGLTRQLLTFSRQRVLRVDAVDANALLAKLRNMLARLLPESISLELRLGDNLPTMTADYTQVEQVIINLVVNARDAMPHGGTLVVETGLADLAERQHRGASPGPHVVLTIADSGIGMDAETLARIFEPFFTTKGRMGTGLGLATVHGIVEQTGGSLTVDSTPGQGTTFRVYFPITAATAAESAVVADAETGSETILLVEDDALIRRSLAKVLRQHGYAVLEAGSASEALTLHHTQLAGTAVLLSDVALPDRDGLSLAKELRTRYPDMRALFMSGYTEEAVRDLAKLAGGIEFLRKPFAPKVLVHRLQQLLN